MHTTFKEIYKTQENLNHSPSALEEYLNSDGDTEPLAELNRRRINKQDSLKMEGFLTTALFKVMKGDSSQRRRIHGQLLSNLLGRVEDNPECVE